jgi:hypothetical protein
MEIFMTDERKEYLKELSNEFDVPMGVVLDTASILGESEDYDGLVTSLSDYHWHQRHQN